MRTKNVILSMKAEILEPPFNEKHIWEKKNSDEQSEIQTIRAKAR